MRLLFLLQGKSVDEQPGFHAGAQQLVREGLLSGYLPYCYYGELHKAGGWSDSWRNLTLLARDFRPDFVFLQYFHGNITHVAELMAALKTLPNRPLIATSCGDPYHARTLSFRPFPLSLKIASKHSDLLFMSQMGEAAVAAASWGARNIVLWPHSCCQARFRPDFALPQWSPDFDVVFIGSNNRGRNVFSAHNRAARQRHRFVRFLSRRYGTRFALYGKNWEGEASWQGTIGFDDQVSTMRRARIVFGGYPHSMADFYLSDRPFIAMGSGIPLVDFRVPRIEQVFRDGHEWYLFSDEKELAKRTDEILEADSKVVMANAAGVSRRIFESHTTYHRLKQVIEVMDQMREHRISRRTMPPPHLSYLSDQQGAVHNWVG
jgi:spore maturation protein CgeB